MLLLVFSDERCRTYRSLTRLTQSLREALCCELLSFLLPSALSCLPAVPAAVPTLSLTLFSFSLAVAAGPAAWPCALRRRGPGARRFDRCHPSRPSTPMSPHSRPLTRSPDWRLASCRRGGWSMPGAGARQAGAAPRHRADGLPPGRRDAPAHYHRRAPAGRTGPTRPRRARRPLPALLYAGGPPRRRYHRARDPGEPLGITDGKGVPEMWDTFADPDDASARERFVHGLFKNSPHLVAPYLRFAPGEGYAESSLAPIILGAVVQKVAGQPFEAYVRDHILAPLEMRQARCWQARSIPRTWPCPARAPRRPARRDSTRPLQPRLCARRQPLLQRGGYEPPARSPARGR